MKQEAFEARYGELWRSVERWLGTQEKMQRRALQQAETRVFPRRYRQLCQHLALARARQYSPALQERLNRLALRGHRHLYRSGSRVWSRILFFIVAGFPRALRREARFVGVASAVFFVPLFALIAAIQIEPLVAFSVLSPEQAVGYEAMYEPGAERVGRERGSGGDWLAFGHYIFNNTTIGFQTFAGGVLFGLGPLFFLLFNGVFIGAVAGHLTAAGHVETFWPFVAGHGAFELPAIAIAGAAGLKLSFALWSPGRAARVQALRSGALEALPLILGAAGMFLIAAFVEAFWSSTMWAPAGVKYLVAAVLWTGVIGYFALAGRRHAA